MKEHEFIEDIKGMLKNEKGEELVPIVSSFCEGESMSFHKGLDLEEMGKLFDLIGDDFLNLSQDHPIQIKLITKEQDLEATYNGNIFGNNTSPKISFLEAHGCEVSLEDHEAEELNEDAENLTYQQAKEKYGHLLAQYK